MLRLTHKWGARRTFAAIAGGMDTYPLTLTHFLQRAEKLHFDKDIVTSTPAGTECTNYGEWGYQTRLLSGVLDNLNVSKGGRVGTFSWNTAAHLELFFGVPCSGRVLHTLNLRLFPEHLTYIVNHGEDEVIFVDRSLLGLLWPLADTFKTVKHFIVIDDGHGEIPNDPRILDYTTLKEHASPGSCVANDEFAAAAMCYTSGTTGAPKGVVYTHRSMFLHTMGVLAADSLAVCEHDVILPVVPMFHANTWGLAHAAVASGAKLVMPGPHLQPELLADMIVNEKVTVAAGVPTIWMALLPALEGRDTSSLRCIPVGGSAVPKSLSQRYREVTGLPLTQAWGMTETSPVGTVCHVASNLRDISEEEEDELRTSIGRPVLGVDLRIATDDNNDAAWDGETSGELQLRGPWVASSYFNRPDAADSFTEDGYLKTGDVATIDNKGYVRLVDRTKDLIKTGGEWISSVEVENEIMAHPSVKEAAVISVASKKWMERPLACIVLEEGKSVSHEELIEFLTPRMAKWWLPDATEIVGEIPKTSVGKFSKKDLRDSFAGYEVP